MKHYFVPMLFLTGTLFFGYLYIVGPPEGTENYDESAQEGSVSYNRLQNLKQQTAVRLDLEKQQAVLNHNGYQLDLDPGRDGRADHHNTILEESVGPAGHDVDNRGSHEAMTLDQRMDEFIAKKQLYEELENEKRLEYVQTFIREARAMGFDVKVDRNMQIVSVKKINNQ